MKPDWDLSGAVEDMRLLLEVGYRVAEEPNYPEWKPGSEFRAPRGDAQGHEAMMPQIETMVHPHRSGGGPR